MSPRDIAILIYRLEKHLTDKLKRKDDKHMARDLAWYVIALTGCRPCDAAALVTSNHRRVLVTNECNIGVTNYAPEFYLSARRSED